MKYWRNLSRLTLIFLFVPLPFLTGGCGAKRFYAGEKLPASQVAVVELGGLRLLMVDETPTSGFKARKLELLPGEHSLRATIDVDLYEGPIVTYTFTAEAGRKYLFDADLSMKRGVTWQPWIRDLSTGEIVGGWTQ